MSEATVVAKGKLTQYQDVNYLLIDSFQILPAPKPADDTKPKADVPAKEGAWRRSPVLPDQPGVTPLDHHQVYAFLGLLQGEPEESPRAVDCFLKAVAASREITDNRKPLSYSHDNMACPEALLRET